MTSQEAPCGILLAGGTGSRLYPITATVSKQLVAIYNKPMVYYSLTTLMLAGVRDVLVISTPTSIESFRALLGDGTRWGLGIEYKVQAEPNGIAQALILGEQFIADRSVMLMLGDNLFYGGFEFMRAALERREGGAVIFAYRVGNPSEYGVVEFDDDWRAISLEEKPEKPRSSWAVPGVYIYPPGVASEARQLVPSPRGELEITDLNRRYLDRSELSVQPMGRGVAWFDTGTPKSLLEASNFIEAIEQRQGLIVGSPEEVAHTMGFIDDDELRVVVSQLPVSPYRDYVASLLDDAPSGD